MPRLRRRLPALGFLAMVVWSTCGTPGASAQPAVVERASELRVDPEGTLLGTLLPGTRVQVEEERSGWSRVTVEGFIWIQSLQVRREEGFDLVVSEPGGETLHDEPQGRAAGNLVRGALLEEMVRIPGWIRVRRTAWISSAGISSATDDPAAGGDAAIGGLGATTGPISPSGPGSVPASDPGTVPPAVPAAGSQRLIAGRDGLAVLASPDGESVGRTGPGTELRVLEREGNWARVRLDGWVWLPDADALGDAGGEAGEPITAVSVRELAEEPGRFRGRHVQMELEFLSLEVAEAIRTDFYEGEPFILSRTRGPERAFVYVAVPRERVGEVEGLGPLEPFRITGRVRTGAAAFTGNPILDLIEVERLR